MSQFSNIVSQIGAVSPLNPVVIPMDLAKGTQIGNWTVPFNMPAVSLTDLFRAFGLWQSTNGLCMAGVNHASSNRWTVTANTLRPVLVGDRVDGRFVSRAVNSYNNRSRLWSVSIEWGIPQPPIDLQAKDYAYLVATFKHLENQSDRTLKLVDDFFTQVMTKFMAGGYPVTPLPTALAAWEVLKAGYEGDMKKTLDEVEATQWNAF
jgi:hypothetical protein